MALRDEIENPTRRLDFKITVAGVVLVPFSPELALGVPGVLGFSVKKSIANPVPVASIRVNRIHQWVPMGKNGPTSIEVGFNGSLGTIFKGYTQDRAPGEFDGIIHAAGKSFVLWRTVQIPEQTFGGLTTKAAITKIRDYATTENLVLDIPDVVNVDPDSTAHYVLHADNEFASLDRARSSQMIQIIADVENWVIWESNAGNLIFRDRHKPGNVAFRSFSTGTAATAWIIGQRSNEDPTALRTRMTVLGGTITSGEEPNETTFTPEGEASITPASMEGLVELPEDSFIDDEYSNSLIHTQDRADDLAIVRLNDEAFIPRQTTMRIPGDPELDIGQTIELNYPEKNLVAKFYIYGIEHRVDKNGYKTILDLRGGENVAAEIGVVPTAGFTDKIDREIYQDDLYIFATFDARTLSYAAGGGAITYAWSDNQGAITTPDINSETAEIVTVSVKASDISGDWVVSLQVTDTSSGLVSDQVDVTVDVTPSGADVQIPAVFAAIDNRQTATPDGGQNWYDRTDVDVVSVAARPPDGVLSGIAVYGHADGTFMKTTDFCQTALTLATKNPNNGDKIWDLLWDYRNLDFVWAVDDAGVVWRSGDGGDTFVVYEDLAATLGLVGSLTLRHIGLPLAGGIWVYGGDGAGNPVIAYDSQLNHNWTNLTLGGELAEDIPATDNAYRIVHATDNGGGLTIALENADATGDAGTALSFASGTYTGDGTTGRAITGIGFSPKMLVVKADAAANGHAMILTSLMSEAQNITNGTANDGIASLDSNGFTVDDLVVANGRTNEDGVTYHWFAFAGANCVVGSYTGDGGASQKITGIGGLPVIVFVTEADTSQSVLFRQTEHTTTHTLGVGSQAADMIISLDVDGFTVGDDDDVNQDGVTYFYIALLASPNLVTGTYSGDSADPRDLPAIAMDFNPDFVGIRATNATQEFRWKTTDLTPDDASFQMGGEAAVTNRIQDLTPATAGKFEVGNDNDVNTSVANLEYSFFAVADGLDGAGGRALPIYYNPNPLVTSGWVRASGLPESFIDASFVVPGPLLTEFYVGEQGSRSVWRCPVGGISYTENTDLFPEDVSSHHAIWLPSFVHNLNTANVYLIACENTVDQSSGIYKSADAFQTVQVVRPVTGFSTWP